MCGKTSDSFARAILPHTVIKTEQLTLYLDARSRLVTGARFVDETIVSERKDVAKRLKRLKRQEVS